MYERPNFLAASVFLSSMFFFLSSIIDLFYISIGFFSQSFSEHKAMFI